MSRLSCFRPTSPPLAGLSVGSPLLLSEVLLVLYAASDAVLGFSGGFRDDCGGEVGERTSSPMGEEKGIRGICGICGGSRSRR